MNLASRKTRTVQEAAMFGFSIELRKYISFWNIDDSVRIAFLFYDD